MANNLLQASQVYSHRPIALQEAPEPWQTAEAALDTLLDPEQRRADLELQYTKEMADKNYKLAQDSLALDRQKTTSDISNRERDYELRQDRLDADIFASAIEDMPLQYAASLADSLDVKGKETYTAMATDYIDAKKEFDTAVSGNDLLAAKKAYDDNYGVFSTNKKELLNIENKIEGMFSKDVLSSLLTIPGVKEAVGDSTYARWSKVDTMIPAHASIYLKNFLPAINQASILKKDKMEMLKDVGAVLSTVQKQSVDVGTDKFIGSLEAKLDEYFSAYMKEAGIDLDSGAGGAGGVGGQGGAGGKGEVGGKKISTVSIGAEAKKVKESPMWKEENFMWISKDKKRKIFNARKAKQTLSKILNRNVTEKEARKIYEQLETVFGKTMVKAKDVIGEGARAVGRGALNIAAIGRGSPTALSFEDVAIPISGAYAGTQPTATDATDRELDDLFNRYESTAP